jgi:hypothetical protein
MPEAYDTITPFAYRSDKRYIADQFRKHSIAQPPVTTTRPFMPLCTVHR